MAITADKIRKQRAVNNKITETRTIVTGQTVYLGALVNFPGGTSQRVRGSANTAAHMFAGVVEEIVNETGSFQSSAAGNTAGTMKCRIAYGHQVIVSVGTAARTATSLGKNVFALDNDTVSDATAAGTALVRVNVGTLVEFTDSTKASAWVELRRIAARDAA